LQQLTYPINLGAKRVYFTVERIRHSDSSGVKTDTTPVFALYTDATPRSGLELLHNSLPKMDLVPKALPPKARVLLVNVWRPFKTITGDPLAFLVPGSVKAEERHADFLTACGDFQGVWKARGGLLAEHGVVWRPARMGVSRASAEGLAGHVPPVG
jgi:hypothetical protein